MTILSLAVFALAVLAIGAGAQPHPLIVALGDSITYGWRLPHPATQNYAALYARRVGGRLVDLAVPAYTCADVARHELPRMPPGASVVILNCGTNDIGGFGPGPGTPPSGRYRIAPATATQLLAAENVYKTIVATIRRKEPAARIVAVTVRSWQRMTGPEDPRFSRDVTAWNAMIRTQPVHVADIAADPRMYRPAFVQHDLLHPTVAGNTVIADAVFATTH
jgi:lysophospholipase L1-like esterase